MTTYIDNNGNERPREQLVVFFTDGYPGKSESFAQDNAGSNGDAQVVADATVSMANQIKAANARIYSIGIFTGADPTAAYTTTNNNGGYQTWTPEAAAANGLLHFISNDYAANEVTSWSASTKSPNNVAGYHNNGYYHAPHNPEALSAVFTSIANNISSVALPLNAQTIVQDVVSEHFHLPDNTSGNICVYTAPYTGGTYNFGAKVPMANPNIEINGKTVQVMGFDFSENWVGYHNGTEPHGNKLIIEVPLIVNEGVWGDGIATNDITSVIFPNGDLHNPIGPFPMPYANVHGEVWTVVVDSEPDGFDPMNIDSPEDLAWFISVVNGRNGYAVNGNLQPASGTNGKLTADIDMSTHNWVAIGSNGVTYEGTFDGNGQVITGLKNNASKFYQLGTTNAVVYPGMFGKVSGTVHNVFVLDSEFRAKKHDRTKIHYGILIDTLLQGGMLYNSEAAGRLMTNNEEGNETLILGGLVGLNQGTIHFCMSMAQLTGFTMGGGVGAIEANAHFENSFVNPQFDYLGSRHQCYSGGLAAINHGIILRAYVLFERSNSRIDQSKFGRYVGDNYLNWGSSGKVYAPNSDIVNTVPDTHVYRHNDTGVNVLYYRKPIPKYLYSYRSVNDNSITTNDSQLLNNLNSGLPSGYSIWKRTTAGNYSEGAGDINDDYPILAFDYACVGSSDGILLDYSHSLDDMLKRHNEGKLNQNTQLGDNYKKTQHEAIYGGTVNLYKHQSTGLSTADNVVVYIDEDIALLQDEGSSIEAYTCQTLTKPNEYWHTVSSSLQKSMIGFNYHTTGQVPFNWDPNPCNVSISETPDDYCLFPHDLDDIEHIDLFCFYEPEYHWINLKRNSNSHWHMNDTELPIKYDNESFLIPGKGYLTAIDKDIFMQNRGILNNGKISIPVTATQENAWAGLLGHNLIGNPYQSYLDFEAFAQTNAELWNGNSKFARTYAVYDAETDCYLQYMSGASTGSNTASRYINMHQGFFIIKSGSKEEALYTNEMRTMTKGNGFREEASSYPLINLTVSDERGKKDNVVLELGRTETVGAPKMNISSGNGTISLRHEGADFAILFTDIDEGGLPLSFSAKHDGRYTLYWNTANAEFSFLTLVDHITGQKCDILANDHYCFEATTDQYTSRFRIVIEKNTDNSSIHNDNQNFAFLYEGSIIVNATGFIEVIDPLGRRVYSTSLTHTANGITLPSFAKGIYLLRLTDNNTIKTQKIVF